jgi:hypothetical protein
MIYRVRIDPVAQGQIDHFAKYLSEYTVPQLPVSRRTANSILDHLHRR